MGKGLQQLPVELWLAKMLHWAAFADADFAFVGRKTKIIPRAIGNEWYREG